MAVKYVHLALNVLLHAAKQAPEPESYSVVSKYKHANFREVIITQVFPLS